MINLRKEERIVKLKEMNLKKIKSFVRNFNFKNFSKKLLSLEGTPSRLAFSFALGIFIGIVVPMGFQSFVSVPLAVLTGCNVFLTTSATLITNPFTAVPVYLAIFRIGEFFLRTGFSFDIFFRSIKESNFEIILSSGANGLFLYLTGSFVLGIFLATTLYIIFFYTIKVLRHNRSQNITS